MKHCHGSPFEFIEADCGDVGPHDEHDFNRADKMCLGSPAEFIEAGCGRVGPHNKHPMSQEPAETVDNGAHS